MTLRRHHNLTSKPITFLGIAYTPTDGGSSVTNPTSVTPVSGLVTGDLVLLICSARQANQTLTITTSGGQTWNALTAANGNQNTTRMFWCRFNGSWSANPAFTTSSGSPTSIGMVAFRPSIPGKSWAVDVSLSNTAASYLNIGDVITVTGQTTTRQKTVTLCVIATNGSPIYKGASFPWLTAGYNQYRNNAQLTIAVAYRIKNTQGATGNMVNQILLSPSAGNTSQSIITFYET